MSDSPAGRRARGGRREMRGDGDGEMSGESLNAYERQRAEKIARNAGFLHALGIQQLIPEALKENEDKEPSDLSESESEFSESDFCESESELSESDFCESESELSESDFCESESEFSGGRRQRRGDGDGEMSGEPLNAYELQRAKNIARNAERFSALGLQQLIPKALKENAKPTSGGPNTRSSTKRKRASESDSERAKKTRSISEAIEFFGIKERSSEQVHALREKFIGFFERAYASHCRAGTTKKKMMSEKQAHRWVKFLGLSGIERVHKRLKRSPIDLARNEAHLTKTGKDALGPRGRCFRCVDCDNVISSQWCSKAGRYYDNRNSNGRCKPCAQAARTGIPSRAMQKEQNAEKAKAILDSGVVEDLFPEAEMTEPEKQEEKRRFLSHVLKTGENPKDMQAKARCVDCDKVVSLKWFSRDGCYRDNRNSNGMCQNCARAARTGIPSRAVQKEQNAEKAKAILDSGVVEDLFLETENRG